MIENRTQFDIYMHLDRYMFKINVMSSIDNKKKKFLLCIVISYRYKCHRN